MGIKIPADGLSVSDSGQRDALLLGNCVPFQPKIVNFASNVNLNQHYYLYVYNVLPFLL